MPVQRPNCASGVRETGPTGFSSAVQEEDPSSANGASAHDLTLNIPLPMPLPMQLRSRAALAPGAGAVDISSVPPPSIQTEDGTSHAAPGQDMYAQPPSAWAGQPLLMWVRPLLQRSGDSMLFEMRPAQELPSGCWAQTMPINSWLASNTSCTTVRGSRLFRCSLLLSAFTRFPRPASAIVGKDCGGHTQRYERRIGSMTCRF